MNDKVNWLCWCCGSEGFNPKWPELKETPDGGHEVFILKTCEDHQQIVVN